MTGATYEMLLDMNLFLGAARVARAMEARHLKLHRSLVAPITKTSEAAGVGGDFASNGYVVDGLFFLSSAAADFGRTLLETRAERAFRHQVEKFGWAGVYLAPREEPHFVYTAGFGPSLGAPELVISGVTFADGHGIAAKVFERVKTGEWTVSEGARFPGLSSFGRDLIARRVHVSWITADRFAAAAWYNDAEGPSDLMIYQLVAPDAQEVYPWEPGFDEAMREYQLPLYEPRG